MNLKRPVKLSARCCHNGAKIFLAHSSKRQTQFLSAKTLYADLCLVVCCSSYEVVTEEFIGLLSYYADYSLDWRFCFR